MKEKIIAIVLTLLFVAVQLVLPKFTPIYLEWIGYEEGGAIPFGFVSGMTVLWGTQFGLLVRQWYKALEFKEEE